MLALICWMRHEAMKRSKTVDESHNALSENIGCSLILQGNAHPSGKNTLILPVKHHQRTPSRGGLLILRVVNSESQRGEHFVQTPHHPAWKTGNICSQSGMIWHFVRARIAFRIICRKNRRKGEASRRDILSLFSCCLLNVCFSPFDVVIPFKE